MRPPLADLPVLEPQSELIVLADITHISVGRETPGKSGQLSWSYDAVARVEQTLKGPQAASVEVRVPYYNVLEQGALVPTKFPGLELNERVVLFLTRQSA